MHLWLKKPICATTRTTPSLPGDLRGSPLTAKSAHPGHSHVLQHFRYLQEKQHRPSVVVEIRDGQHPIHTCQRFQRTTAAIYQQRADLKRWSWWGGSVWYTCPQRMALCCVTDCGRQCSTVGGGYVHFCQSLSMPCTVINKKSRHFL